MDIDKKMFYLTLEIIFLGAVICLSNILWWTFDYEKESNLAYAYSNYKELTLNYNELDGQIELIISNESSINRRYKLYMILDNNEYIENINYPYSTIGNKIYYLIDEKIINGEETEKKIININVKSVSFKIEEL